MTDTTPDRFTLARRIGTDIGLLALRLSFGLMMFLGHGLGKMQRFSTIGTPQFRFGDPLGIGAEVGFVLAGLAEGVAALLIALGLGTRLVAVPLIFTMGVAAFIAHADDPFATKEKALMYGSAFTAILLLGPGRLSLDHLLGGWFRRDKKPTN